MPTAAPRSVSRARRPAWLSWFDATAESTTRRLTGTCLAAARGSRSTNSATPSDTATSTATVRPFRSERVADGQREEHAEHHRGAALERRADRCAHRDLDHHEGGQRREDRVRRARDRLSDRPSQSGRQPRLGHGADLGRRRTVSTRRRGPGAATVAGHHRRGDGTVVPPRSALSPQSARRATAHVPTLGRRRRHNGGIRNVADRLEGWPRERLAERLSAACYGTVLVLAALPLIDADEVSSGLGWELVTGVGVATWVAHLYAEVVGDHLRRGSALDRIEINRAMLDGLPILLAAVLPAVVLLLGRVDVLEPRVALWVSVAVAIGQLVAVGAFVGASVSTDGATPWSYAAATAAIGIAVVILKLVLGH